MIAKLAKNKRSISFFVTLPEKARLSLICLVTMKRDCIMLLNANMLEADIFRYTSQSIYIMVYDIDL